MLMAMILDAIWGDPKWIWSRLMHPVVVIGKLISLADKHFNRYHYRKIKGLLLLCNLVFFGAALGWLLGMLGGFIEIILIAILIAQKSLSEHVSAVSSGCRKSLVGGRLAVAHIVGRDTSTMEEPEVIRAAIESAAENFSDGVVAPIFWYLVAGLPALIVYKCVNTADSMIGYKTKTYQEFGWASARLDDFLNWMPARLSAIILLWSKGNLFLKGWSVVISDAKRHRSPNAGWPEAAMAYGLDIALAGPRSYEGKVENFAWVNERGNRSVKPHDIQRALHLLWSAWTIIFTLLFICLAFNYLNLGNMLIGVK